MNTGFDHMNWKPSIYNLILSQTGRHLIYNSVHSKILKVNDRQMEIINNCLQEIERTGNYPNKKLLNSLVDCGFLVRHNVDENQRERDKFLTNKLSRERLLLTIAPTMACNVRCSYCFQKNLNRRSFMSHDIQRGLIEFVRRKLKEVNGLTVQWFGGEPLLAYDEILTLSNEFQKLCNEVGIPYWAEMLTNGILLTPDIIETFQDISIRAIQIPLDGNPKTYAERKQISLEKAENYYNFVIDNIQSIVDITGSVTIRINVDRDNAEEAKSVVSMFKKKGIIDPRIDFRLGFLNTSRGILDCIPHDCFSNTEFDDLEQEFRHYLAETGYMVYGMPVPLEFPCSAVVDNAYTIDPLGEIGKCVPATGTQQSMFGQIYPNNISRTLEEINLKEAPYSKFNPFDSQYCKGCNLLPICLGSCPKMHEPDGVFACRLKEGFIEKLDFYYKFHKIHSK